MVEKLTIGTIFFNTFANVINSRPDIIHAILTLTEAVMLAMQGLLLYKVFLSMDQVYEVCYPPC